MAVQVIKATRTQAQAAQPAGQKLRTCCYCRVSTDSDEQEVSYESQIKHFTDYINGHPDMVLSGVYADEAKTGTKEDRAQFQDLLVQCRAGAVDMVITKSISRFARNTVTLLKTVRELKKLGVDVFFEEQNIHTISAAGGPLRRLFGK